MLGLQEQPPGSGYVSMTASLPMLRAIKDADKLERLAAAGAAASASFEEIPQVRFAGRTESQVGADFAHLLRKHGPFGGDFTVVGSGPNDAITHHELGQRVSEEGDTVVLDFGGIRDDYGSDTTRTVQVGELTEGERKSSRSCLTPKQAGLEAVGPGVACQELDRAARKVIADAGCGDGCIHRVGHGNRPHSPGAAVHGRRRDTADRAGNVLLDRARDLDARALRRAHRGHRRRDRGRRPARQPHQPRPARRRLIGEHK